ncbi:hypothetical protein JNUCC0626_25495 [Lentzea sp. JNUCC 0626]|uniref:hypothetical protein n=1 Tax=Lentzea sp. JNUCC 0626 TaxID=3367513 RepID=UPI003747C2F8
MRTLWKTLIAASAFAALVVGAPAAQAAPVQNESAVSVTESEDGCFATAWGYRVAIKCGPPAAAVGDYNLDRLGDEVFAVRSDRVVIHIWPGSGGWRPLTNGRADKIDSFYFQPSSGYRLLKVWVNGSGLFCTSYEPGRNWYNFWKC